MTKRAKAGNYGWRGWMLIIYAFSSMIAFMVFTSYPQNILGEYFGAGNANLLTSIYSTCNLVNIAIGFIVKYLVGYVKNIKVFSSIWGAVTLAFAVIMLLIKPDTSTGHTIIIICYVAVCILSPLYANYLTGVVVGQWFPTKKGAIMGIATIAFPVGNMFVGYCRNWFMASNNAFTAFLPFLIVVAIGIILSCTTFADFPEQNGCFRDNDPSMTKEKAEEMMRHQQENKKHALWNPLRCASSLGFWFVSLALLPAGISAAMMAQSFVIISTSGLMDQFATVMLIVGIVAAVGSWLVGVVDNKFGTRKAIILEMIIMLLSSVLGFIGGPICTWIAMILLGIYMGAGSNFPVSAIYQWWRPEDFSKVSASSGVVTGIIGALLPILIRTQVTATGSPFFAYLIQGCGALVGLICMLIFRGTWIKKRDDKYRQAAGLALDDYLTDRATR